jgi:hypothetical protein
MPVTIPDIKKPEINSKELQDYIDSLAELLKKYVPSHDINLKK